MKYVKFLLVFLGMWSFLFLGGVFAGLVIESMLPSAGGDMGYTVLFYTVYSVVPMTLAALFALPCAVWLRRP
jgi:hypothetical protein